MSPTHLRFGAAAVAWHRQSDRTYLGLHGLGGVAVAVVASTAPGRITLLIAEVIAEFGLQPALEDRLDNAGKNPPSPVNCRPCSSTWLSIASSHFWSIRSPTLAGGPGSGAVDPAASMGCELSLRFLPEATHNHFSLRRNSVHRPSDTLSSASPTYRSAVAASAAAWRRQAAGLQLSGSQRRRRADPGHRCGHERKGRHHSRIAHPPPTGAYLR
jgi:hypothetical protein